MEGLEYLHANGYIHCDIKLPNIFCHEYNNEQIHRVKIGDFGLIHKIDPETKEAFIEQVCGTIGYIAPEIKNKSFITTAADMWSLGIVIYQLTVGYLPHILNKKSRGLEKYQKIVFRDVDWKKRSPELKDFVENLLKIDPKQRMTVGECKNHKWLN